MQKGKPRIPNNGQQIRQKTRRAILGQQTTDTENIDRPSLEQKVGTTTNSEVVARGAGELVAPVNREMYPTPEQKIPWDKYGVYVAIAIAGVAFIWYLASQDSNIKTLADDSKELKKKADETTRFTIETGLRLTNVEQRLSGVEQRERSVVHPNGSPAQTAPKK